MDGGNVYDKYGSRHPIERRLVDGFLAKLEQLVESTGAREVHEVGCGEGELAMRLARRGLRVRGSDVSGPVIAEARRRAGHEDVDASFKVAGVEALNPGEDAAELIVCCEVMEHLEDPEAALGVLSELAAPWLVVSVGAALAGAQPVPPQVRARARQHPGTPPALVTPRVPDLRRATLRGRRGSLADALDNGSVPGRSEWVPL